MGRDLGSDMTSLIFPASALGCSVSAREGWGASVKGSGTGNKEEKRGEITGARWATTGAAGFHYFVTSLIVITGFEFLFFSPPKPQFLSQTDSWKSQLWDYKWMFMTIPSTEKTSAFPPSPGTAQAQKAKEPLPLPHLLYNLNHDLQIAGVRKWRE